MEHDSSFNKQLRKEITAKAVINEKIRMIEAVIDKNNEQLGEIRRDVIGIQKD